MVKVHMEKDLTGREPATILFVGIVFYFISKNNYLLFHSLIEIITISLSFSIMLIAIGTMKICNNKYLSYLGIACGFVGIIDLFHVITYKGMEIMTSSSNISIQLCIAAKYYGGMALVVAFYYLKKEINVTKVVIYNSIMVLIILASIFVVKIFPACYIEGYGLTKFKVYSEYIISLMFLLTIFLLNSNVKFKSNKENKILILAIIFKTLSEMFFSFYVEVYDFSNYVGHIMKFVCSYYLYKALLKSIIINPYSSLIKNLNLKVLEIEMKNEELVLAKGNVEKEYLKYKRLIDFIPEGILIIEDYTIAYANNKIISKLGLNDGANIINRLDIKNKNKFVNPTEGKLCYNGKNLDVEISTLFMKNETGEDCFISVIRDIYDSKRANEMESLLIEKEKEDKFKNDFFANISHELRTPINVIYSAVQLESMYLGKKDIGSIINYNSIIKQNCLRLIRITNNIIDTTKIQAGFLKAKSKSQNIVNIVEEITMSITTYSDYKNINVTFDTEYEEIYVKCDENLIERIILNLLSNSVKYGKQEGNIEVSIYKKNNYSIEISVKDDGIGIPKESQSTIFERFERVDKSISRNTEGSGIGLYLVKVLVEMQGGNISINSEINQGTEVLMMFPIVQAVDEICVTAIDSKFRNNNNVIEKIDIEFSDIYR
jgi:signal transduction histidine kinase